MHSCWPASERSKFATANPLRKVPSTMFGFWICGALVQDDIFFLGSSSKNWTTSEWHVVAHPFLPCPFPWLFPQGSCSWCDLKSSLSSLRHHTFIPSARMTHATPHNVWVIKCRSRTAARFWVGTLCMLFRTSSFLGASRGEAAGRLVVRHVIWRSSKMGTGHLP